MDTLTFACYNKDEAERLESSSGGIYPLIAKHIIQNKGIVFAVCYDSNFETVLRKIETLEEIVLSQGSKYVAARIGDAFLEVKENLEAGKEVLFVGTPCHCAGLKSYLAGRKYTNLLCLDFVCHGVPSRVAWRRFLSNISINNNIIKLNMRDKSTGWSRYRYSWKILTDDGKRKIIPQEKIKYMEGFTQNYFLRPSCYECRFKGTNRSTDITLGDYWGVWDIQPGMDDDKGTSLLMIHTEKGKKIFEQIEEHLVWKQTPLDKAVRYNPSITQSAKLTDKRDRFFYELKNGKDFDQIIDELSQITLLEKAKKRVKAMIRNFMNK